MRYLTNKKNTAGTAASVFALILMLFVVFCLPEKAWAEDTGTDVSAFTYSIAGSEDDQYAVITMFSPDALPEDGSVVIPGELGGYPVRVIASRAFQSVSGMKSVVIPDSVETINEKAFWLSGDMTSVTFGNGLTTIGSKAFYETGLTEISLPPSLQSLGSEAFSNCYKLRTVSISTGLTSVGADIFPNCLALESFSVEEGSPYLAAYDGVLYTADGATLIKYPPARKVSGAAPEEYAVRAGTRFISDFAFQYAGYVSTGSGTLKSVSMPDSVETIGASAFEYCTGLTEFGLPASVSQVGQNAFNGCSNITTINIPAGLASIPSDAFAGCNKITDYNVAEGNPYYASDNGVLYDAGYKTFLKYPAARTDTAYTVADGCTAISDYAFQKADKLESIAIPEDVVSIGDYAFAECYGLREIALPDTLRTIGSYAFMQCPQLRSVNIPDQLRELGEGAFFVSGIEEAIIPGTVESVGGLTFMNCSNLSRVVMNRGTRSIGDSAFALCPRLEEITIPQTVESIGSGLLDVSGTALDGQPIKIIGYIQSAGEDFFNENAEKYNIVFERAVQPVDQIIRVTKSRTCSYGCKPFAIGATAKTALLYKSSNDKIARISDKGVVTITGFGKAAITIWAGESNEYNAAEARVTINVTPARPTLKAKNLKGRRIKIVWSKATGVSGYEVYIKAPGQKKFHKRATRNAAVKSITHSGLKKKKYYSYKVRAFKVVDGKKIYGPFSKTRKVKVKK